MNKKPILLVLLLALGLRLYHVNFPVAGWHSWRQADTSAIARNFYENGFKLFYPQIDWGGNSPGFVESEFQLYPFLVSLLYALFGVSDMWGRLLSTIFSIATIYGLYLLARKHVSEQVALWASLFYAILPLTIYFGRAFMPESAIAMSSVLGIYWFSVWLDTGALKDYILAWFFVSLAVLLKIPTLYLGMPLAFLAWQKHGKAFLKMWELWLFASLVLAPAALWYYHAHQIYLRSGLTFGIWNFDTGKWGNLDLLTTPRFYFDVLLKGIARLLAYAGIITLFAGLFMKRHSQEERLFDWWLVSVVIYSLIVAKGNQMHAYYQLPFALPAVVFTGKALANFLPVNSIRHPVRACGLTFSFFGLFLIAIFVLSYVSYSDFMRLETPDSSLSRLSVAVKEVTARGDLIVAVSEGNPVVLYRCERKGWNSSPEQLDSAFLQKKHLLGAKYLVGEKTFFNTPVRQLELSALLQKLTVVKNDKDYFIVKFKDS
jgi:4-amino-4-deoxy-L-arabinose transferase-like glycosyltransferase